MVTLSIWILQILGLKVFRKIFWRCPHVSQCNYDRFSKSISKNNNDFIQFDIPIVDEIFWSNVYVEFWHKFQFDTLNDGGYFMVSFDESPYYSKEQIEYGDLPENYLQWIDFCGTYYEYGDLFADSINGFTGAITDWSYTRILFVFNTPVKMAIFL